MQNEPPSNDAAETDMASGEPAAKEGFNSPAQEASKPGAKNWKRANRSKAKLQDNHWPRRVLFTSATLVAISVFAFITIAPLLTWQTTFVTLAIDNYKFGLIQPVAYRDEDISAIQKALQGRCSPATSRNTVDLSSYETSNALQNQLANKIRDFRFRRKDVLLAYVRAQSFVSTLPTEESTSTTYCQLAAADFSLNGPSPSGMVRCSHVLDSLSAGTNKTTLIAMDLGNVVWDPRLGTLANFAPTKLDKEIATGLSQNDSQPAGDCWLITSHDSLEFSHVSLADHRSLFSKALELALLGKADESPWGDNDGIIELDETAKFVHAITYQWSRKTTGGRYTQQPAVWKLGSGKVPIDEIPRDIRLLRAPSKSFRTGKTWLADWFSGGSSDSNKTPETARENSASDVKKEPHDADRDTKTSKMNPAGSEVPATPEQTRSQDSQLNSDKTNSTKSEAKNVTTQDKQAGTPPQNNEEDEKTSKKESNTENSKKQPATEKQSDKATNDPKTKKLPDKEGTNKKSLRSQSVDVAVDIWQLLETLGHESKQNNLIRIGLRDYAPHVVHTLNHLIALAELTELEGGERGDSAGKLLTTLKKSFIRLGTRDRTTGGLLSQSATAAIVNESIKEAIESAKTANAEQAWQGLSESVSRLLQARNDALNFINDAIELNCLLSGGDLPSTIDVRMIRNCLDEIAAATTVLRNYDNESEDDRKQADLVDSHTQLLLHKIASLKGLIDATASTLLGDNATDSTTAYYELMQMIRSPALRLSTRNRLKEQFRLAQNKKPVLLSEQLLPTSTAPATVLRSPPQLVLQQISELALLRLDFLSVALGIEQNSSPPPLLEKLEKDIEETRNRFEKLVQFSVAQDQVDVIAEIFDLGQRTATIFETIRSLALTREFRGPRDQINNDCLAGILRSLDWRDAFAANSEVIIPPPNLGSAKSQLLTLEITDKMFDGRRIHIKAIYSGERESISNSLVSFSFDPAVFQVFQSSGAPIGRKIKFPASKLEWRGNQLQFEVQRLATSTLFIKDQSTKIEMSLHENTKSTRAEINLPVLNRRDIVLAARGHPLTVVGPRDPDGWTHVAYKESISEPAPDIQAEAKTPTLTLRSWPSGETAWEIGVENLSDVEKQVTVRVFASQDELKTSPLEAFQLLKKTITDNANKIKPILVSKSIPLQPNSGVTRVTLVPPTEGSDKAAESDKKQDDKTAEEQSNKPDKENTTAAENKQETVQINSELAVVIDDATQIGTTSKMVFRVHLEPIHPRHFVESNAVYDAGRREIRVVLKPLSDAPESFPPDGISALLQPIPQPSRATSQVKTLPKLIPRKPEIAIQQATSSGTAIAAWTGPDRGQAFFALNVNNYPRALIFAVDCSPTTSETVQFPQYDWRSIRIKTPAVARTLVRSPARTVPFSLEVDAPADTFQQTQGEGGSVDIIFRPISVGTVQRTGEQIVWSGANDRQVILSMPKQPKTFAITTEVSDWQVEASGNGFSNVDVTAIARISLAGQQSSANDSRTIVFDGIAPFIDAPPSAAVLIGRDCRIPIRVADDVSDGFFIAPDRVRPGVSGLANVEWAIDTEGLGKPEKWDPAVWIGDVRYEIRLKTEKLSPGVRLPLLIRAVDKVGLSNTPTRVWLDVAAQPASPNNDVVGRVTLDGKGEPNVTVALTGPAGERTVKTGKNGEFSFTNLEPGDYSISANGAIRNTTRSSDLVKITLPASPAPPATILLKMK